MLSRGHSEKKRIRSRKITFPAEREIRFPAEHMTEDELMDYEGRADQEVWDNLNIEVSDILKRDEEAFKRYLERENERMGKLMDEPWPDVDETRKKTPKRKRSAARIDRKP
jgi:hypothetical protein